MVEIKKGGGGVERPTWDLWDEKRVGGEFKERKGRALSDPVITFASLYDLI